MLPVSIKALIGVGTLFLMTSAASAAQVIVNVPGNGNPYLAGQASGVSGGSGDTTANASPTLALTGFAEDSVITFSASGGFDYSGNIPATASADGNGSPANMTSSALGISGPQNVNFNGLVGVFLGDDINTGAAPASRNDGTNFTSIAPELYQIFWIGDGLTGTGTGDVQQFVAPVGATRLFLGATDGSGWWNNSGISTVTINYTPAAVTPAVPELSTWAMMILGFCGVGFMTYRKRARRRMIFA